MSTQHFVGTKIVKARAMTRGEYNAYRGWTLPPGEAAFDMGYLVEYLDGGGPNDPRHAGYISWSPEAPFKEAYLAIGGLDGLTPHQQRLIGERAQLEDKLTKLHEFLKTPIFTALAEDDKVLLEKQVRVMEDYSAILAVRLERC